MLPPRWRHLLVNLNGESAHEVYVGRPSSWGNPFEVQHNVPGTREVCIEAYAHYLTSSASRVREARKQLRGKVLGCWCVPLACHGEILVRIANTTGHVGSEGWCCLCGEPATSRKKCSG